MANILLTILAHPDDAEFICGGTLIRLTREQGWQVHIASMTAGDCGSTELLPEEIGRIRREEGARAAASIGGQYHCLEERDLLIFYNERAVERITRLLREVRPCAVVTHSPSDYMADHEVTSYIARAATFGAPVPNFFRDRGHRPPLEQIPYLYYGDAIEGKDPLGRDIVPGFCIDISNVIDAKADMLACHASQREWLRKHHGMDHYLQAMRDWGAQRGRQCDVSFAEGFRQHLGHSYPQDNLLGNILGTV
jgi:LmbE family N-acetylglucosaminyl deacetylase